MFRRFFLISALLSSVTSGQNRIVPVLKERIPDFQESLEETGRTIDLSQFFGTETIMNEMIRLQGSYEDELGNPISLNLDFLLFQDRTPLTRDNFLGYVDRNDYLNSIVHRTVSNFVIQGGGFTISDAENIRLDIVPTQANLLNEFGVSNTRGTISMAKNGSDPDSATSQWFVSLAVNSDDLDDQNGGFTVFGRISRSTFNNALFLDPATANTPFMLANLGGAYSTTPLHESAFGDPPPPLTPGDFFRFNSFTRVPVPDSEATTDPTLTYTVTPLVGSADFPFALNGDQLEITYPDPVDGQIAAYTVVATDSVGNEVENTFFITLNQNLQNYDSWRSENFSSEQQADDEISGPFADANNDGRSNLQAFAQGFDPFENISNDFSNVTQFPDTNQFNLSFRFRNDLGGVRIRLEGSDNLTDWNLVPFTEGFGTAVPPGRQLIVAVNESTRPRNFYRLAFLLD